MADTAQLSRAAKRTHDLPVSHSCAKGLAQGGHAKVPRVDIAEAPGAWAPVAPIAEFSAARIAVVNLLPSDFFSMGGDGGADMATSLSELPNAAVRRLLCLLSGTPRSRSKTKSAPLALSQQSFHCGNGYMHPCSTVLLEELLRPVGEGHALVLIRAWVLYHQADGATPPRQWASMQDVDPAARTTASALELWRSYDVSIADRAADLCKGGSWHCTTFAQAEANANRAARDEPDVPSRRLARRSNEHPAGPTLLDPRRKTALRARLPHRDAGVLAVQTRSAAYIATGGGSDGSALVVCPPAPGVFHGVAFGTDPLRATLPEELLHRIRVAAEAAP